MKQAVLLLHGLLMNRHAMAILGLRLRQAGYADHAFTYRSVRDDAQTHVAALLPRLESMPYDRIHVVGHSMGGVMALKLLERLRGGALARIGRVVLLGAPLAGCESAHSMARHSAGQWLLGRSIGLWRNGYPLHVPEGVAVGSIAGNRRFGLGAMLNTLSGGEANDGVVRVDETRLPGLTDHLVLPVSHSGMLLSPAVARQCLAFISNGRFQRP